MAENRHTPTIDELRTILQPLLEELQAKAWQSARRGKRHSDHVTWRAATAIVGLLDRLRDESAIAKATGGDK